MPTVAIVYHSGFGHTKVLAEAVARGASSVAGTKAVLLSVDDLPGPGPDRKLPPAWDAVHAADAIVFGSPTYMGDVTAKFKKFMEDSSGVWFTQGWKDKIAGGFTNSGGLSGDKLHALLTMMVFSQQHSMIWVGTGLMADGNTPESINRIGSYSGPMAQSDNAGPDVTPPAGDRKTAELFGARIANAAARWTRA